ncbi:hypothetical protein [Lichenicoccus roseus]|uniref:Uncharacterized protein n=1 Tax=Lichenicoccus roseus TaxID=2683649 RepID=A0A5R9J4B4_9PROT|nr:hypothetical protein [Lichenicoccus roseus]TLU71819.1 hypothetical protein FE263_15275 [Lichenicoccus roseus]
MNQPRIPTGTPGRAVVIHGRDQALAALEAARLLPARLVLLSAENAACFLGPLWWAALMDSLQREMLDAAATDLLDCGSSAGRCMEALRVGLRHLVLSPACPQFEAVRHRAEALGAHLVTRRPISFDLAGDRHDLLRRWLQADPDAAAEPGARSVL